MNIKKDHITYMPLFLSKSNYIGNSTFRYQLPNVSIVNSEIALESISLPYSWFNITTKFNNRIFTFAWPTGVGFVYYNVTIPEGFYTIEILNSYFQQFMIQNNLYLKDSNKQNIYYFEILPNETFYKIQINLYDVPTSLPIGFTDPSGLFPFPIIESKPMITIGSSNDFGKLIGFSPQNVTDSILGDLIPQLSPVSQILVSCNNIDNKISNRPDVIHSFTVTNTTFGSYMHIEPSNTLFVDLRDSTISYIDIVLLDQDYNYLVIQDLQIIIKIIIKTRV